MKPEFILGNQLRQYHEATQASKWGNNSVVSSQYHRINNDRSP
ncbi:hypothetical protein SeV_A0789 [Salmonella enterica subsp. enterica serovar Virchow str. SL491]|uniref:Uncharacterized protein n=1 Tax=Salmonella virchow (strain SL491) TaxID=465517 RepID=A0A6C8F035_SALV4|nr:hypothetical protein SeV_A0789 [Salmonella enterica subsp. enterica serovar Virchow str. SL491]